MLRATDWRYVRTSSVSKPRRTMAKEWRAMSPVAMRDEEMGARPSGMARAYGAAWAGTGLGGHRAPQALRGCARTWSRLLTA